MAKKKKTRRDTAEIARSIVEQVTGGKLTGEPLDEDDRHEQSPVVKSRGSEGGKARAKALTEEQRKAIAKKAAQSRWENNG